MKKTKWLVFWTPLKMKTQLDASEIFAETFNDRPDVICVNLKNTYDDFARNTLKTADLVVVFLPQNKKLVEDYFQYSVIRPKRVIYVMMDWVDTMKLQKSTLTKMFRIPDGDLMLMPFDAGLYSARMQGKLSVYLQMRPCEGSLKWNREFFISYDKARRRLREML